MMILQYGLVPMSSTMTAVSKQTLPKVALLSLQRIYSNTLKKHNTFLFILLIDYNNVGITISVLALLNQVSTKISSCISVCHTGGISSTNFPIYFRNTDDMQADISTDIKACF